MSETKHPKTHETATDPAQSYEERLSELLRSLPRETAEDDFTPQVLGRLPANDDAPGHLGRPGRHGGRRPWLLAVAAVLLLTLAVGYREWSHQERQQEAIERMAEMRAEYLVLQEELQELKTQASQQRVVYLGETNGTEVVLDLARLPDNASRLEALRLLQAGWLRAAAAGPESPEGDLRQADYRREPSGPVYY